MSITFTVEACPEDEYQSCIMPLITYVTDNHTYVIRGIIIYAGAITISTLTLGFQEYTNWMKGIMHYFVVFCRNAYKMQILYM